MDSQVILRQLAEQVSASAEHCNLLVLSAHSAQRTKFTELLNGMALGLGKAQFRDIYSDFLAWCGENRIDSNVGAALAQHTQRVSAVRLLHKEIKVKLWLSPRGNELRLHDFLSRVPTCCIDAPQKPYPDFGYWVYESASIKQHWHDYLCFGAQADSRLPRRPLLELDPACLAFDIGAKQSIIFKDKVSGEIILIVLRNFCRDARVLQWVDEVIKEYVELTKSVRVS
jgi:hypothetical protein